MREDCRVTKKDLRVLKELGGLVLSEEAVSVNVGWTVEKFVAEEKTSSPKGKEAPKGKSPKAKIPDKKVAAKKASKPAKKKKRR